MLNQYVTGAVIRRLREQRRLTQQQLADRLLVSEKTISKWENGRGYPDISLVEPLASALGVSLIELFSGNSVINTNRAFNMQRIKVYVCPICGNVLLSSGEATVSCCGIVLPILEIESEDVSHHIIIRQIEDEYYVTLSHEMSKTHYISFIIAVKDDGFEIRKLYPEGNPEARFKRDRIRYLYYFCNQHGLFKVSVR